MGRSYTRISYMDKYSLLSIFSALFLVPPSFFNVHLAMLIATDNSVNMSFALLPQALGLVWPCVDLTAGFS